MSCVVLHKCTGVIFGITQKPASWRLKNKSYFPNHDMLIRTLLSDKFYGAITIKLGQITGYELTYGDLGNMIYFSIFMMQIFPPSQKNVIPKYNAVLIPEQINFFSAAVKNNFNMPGIDKLRTCISYLLKIVNFTNSCTWLISNKYVDVHNFSVSWVLKQS